MATSPDEDIVTQLNTAVGALTKDTNLFRGKMVPPDAYVPHESVFVVATGGPAPQAYVGSVNSVERRYSSVQCTIRSNERDFPAGITLARAVRDALHHASIAGYTDVRILQTEPIYLGDDEESCHMWSVNLELWHEQ